MTNEATLALSAGTKLGPYQVITPLGTGGMGEVYRARDTRLERTVAIKILPAHLSSDPVRKQRFECQTNAISSLNRPHMDSSAALSRESTDRNVTCNGFFQNSWCVAP